MQSNNSFLIIIGMIIFFIILNIVMYYPFVIYNVSFNVADWEKELRALYAYSAGIMNMFFMAVSPIIFQEIKDKVK